MVFGGWPTERIQLNEQSIWAGPPLPELMPGAREAVHEARSLLLAGRYREAEHLVQTRVLHPHTGPRSYQPLGDVLLNAPEGQKEMPPCTMYRRRLDLDKAVAVVEYEANGVRHRREQFVTAVDQVVVLRWTADRPGQISTHIEFTREAGAVVRAAADDTIEWIGQADHEGTHLGVQFAVVLKALATGGSIKREGNMLVVTEANEIILYIAARTDYQMKNPEQRLDLDLVGRCLQDIQQALDKSYERLMQDHLKEYQGWFHRVQLELSASSTNPVRESLPMDCRLETFRNGAVDPGLFSLYFQFGRYLLISSSRPGCMPANLQGIWNPWMKAPWDSDYHININLQMNYWLADVANLSECHLPMLDFIEGLVPSGRQTAGEVYGCRGFVAHYTTDAWMFTAPLGRIVYGMWPMGAGWCTRHLMEYYRFTGDQAFLRERAYPILKEAALFYLDWLVRHPKTGKWISGPSVSPENVFRTSDGTEASLCMGPSMDQQIIWDVFTNVLEASIQLGISNDFTEQVAQVREELALPEIAEDGRLMEWCEPFEEVEPGHRHISHLYGLHPGMQYTRAHSPEMLQAARKSLEYRLAHGGGHTGWSRAWIANLYARLHLGEQAYEHLTQLLRSSTLPNLFDSHPPFQIDGNFGGTAAIAEMLLQSHAGAVELLPALPRAWADGRVSGLRARGGFEVQMTWSLGTLTEAVLLANQDGRCQVRYKEALLEWDAKSGGLYRLSYEDAQLKLCSGRDV